MNAFAFSALALSAVLSSPTPSPAPSASARPAFEATAFGSFRGNLFGVHRSGDTLEYSEEPVVEFNEPVAANSLTYSISPAAPATFGITNGTMVRFVIRMTPGVRYTLSIPKGVRSTTGDASDRSVSFAFETPALVVPRRPLMVARVSPSPYRFGILVHPFPTSLTGATGPRQIALIGGAGFGFARIDYCGAQSENAASGTFDFTIEDGIATQLAAADVTELPIIDQYCAPPWSNGGSTNGVSIWSTPQRYAQFAAGVAKHLAARFPKVTRIELFNEPNLAGWWLAPAPYADATGFATAKYMAAAYAAVKSVAPNMIVVGPALADGGIETDPRTFLTHLYLGGCRVGRCWDVLSVHNYAWMNPAFATARYSGTWGPNRFDIYKDLQAIAVTYGDPLPHVMLTEWGYSTALVPQGFDPAVQARYLLEGATMVLADPTVDGIVWDTFYAPGADFWSETALLNPDMTPRPAYETMRTFASFR